MARYEHLPIYKQAMVTSGILPHEALVHPCTADVAVHFEKIVAGFSCYHKYTLGAELRNQSRGIVSTIIQANSRRDRAPKLQELRVRLNELLVSIRLAKEVQAFKSFKAYQFTVEQVASICRQKLPLPAHAPYPRLCG